MGCIFSQSDPRNRKPGPRDRKPTIDHIPSVLEPTKLGPERPIERHRPSRGPPSPVQPKDAPGPGGKQVNGNGKVPGHPGWTFTGSQYDEQLPSARPKPSPNVPPARPNKRPQGPSPRPSPRPPPSAGPDKPQPRGPVARPSSTGQQPGTLPQNASAQRPSPPIPNPEQTYIGAQTPITSHKPEHVSKVLEGLGEHYVKSEDFNGKSRDAGLIKLKQLGAGGFGVVWLCEREDDPRRLKGEQPKQFALKELMVKALFKPGVDDLKQHIADHIPLNEAAIQQYIMHQNVVRTYWADVRAIDPGTAKPLDVQIGDLGGDGKWASPNKIVDLNKTYTETWQQDRKKKLPASVHLQLRIAMEYCSLGCLKDYLRDPRKAQPESISLLVSARLKRSVSHQYCALSTAIDIAEALKLMHKNRILHGDLKPHNVLLARAKPSEQQQGEGRRGFIAKLADFGLSAHMKRGQENVPIKNGTIAYLPRDAFENMAATIKTDVYALGLILWELWHGIFWFSIYDAEKKRRRTNSHEAMFGYVPRCAEDCPRLYAEVVHACLSSRPQERPEVRAVCKQLNALMSDPEMSPDVR